MDDVVVALFDLATSASMRPPTRPPASASRWRDRRYGRGTLAPYSDIDFFSWCYKRTPRAEQIIEFMPMPPGSGLKVGQAVRSPDDCVRLAKAIPYPDSMSERRFLAARKKLYADFDRRFARGVEAVDRRGFVEAKLAERDQRHRKAGIRAICRTQHQGRQRRPARPADADLDWHALYA